MIRDQRTRILIFLLGAFLLAGQFASLVHATEHPFHVSNVFCISLSALEHSSNTLLTAEPQQLVALFTAVSIIGITTPALIPATYALYQTRAPPRS